MFTGQNLIIAVSFLMVVWYIVGSQLNRRRANQLIEAIRSSTGAVGSRPTIKWFGRSAFQVDIGEPKAPLMGLHMLCLLEPRDFPLAHAWNRIRGRRDQVLIRVDFHRPPRSTARPDPSAYGIPGLTGVEVRPEQPHLQLTLQVAAGADDSVRKCFELAAGFKTV